MKRSPDYSEFDRILLDKLSKGYSKMEIAKFLGCSTSKVTARCKVNGWIDPAKTERGRKGYEAWRAKQTK